MGFLMNMKCGVIPLLRFIVSFGFITLIYFYLKKFSFNTSLILMYLKFPRKLIRTHANCRPWLKLRILLTT